jgi:hypothetical protein
LRPLWHDGDASRQRSASSNQPPRSSNEEGSAEFPAFGNSAFLFERTTAEFERQTLRYPTKVENTETLAGAWVSIVAEEESSGDQGSIEVVKTHAKQ